jgi:hypothetical protein
MMASTKQVMIAPKVSPQRQHVKSLSSSIFDVPYTEDDDDGLDPTDIGSKKSDYISLNTLHDEMVYSIDACTPSRVQQQLVVSIIHGLYNLITNHTKYTQVCLLHPFIISISLS